MTEDPIYHSKACAECGNEFQAPGAMLFDRFVAWRAFCPTCHSIVEEQRKAERLDLERRQREAAWLAICPSEFLSVDRRLLPDKAFFDKVQDWQFQQRGLVVAGETGMAKTRACWHLLRREFCAGRTLLTLSAYDLARWPALVMNESQRADLMMRRIASVDILYMDDPFKSRLTPTVEEMIFVALDERGSRRKPVIFSFNDSSTTLIERLSTDRAKAFLRRIRDYCDVVKPEPKAKTP
jgi:hypothetical protein